jgi:hypothetical protein
LQPPSRVASSPAAKLPTVMRVPHHF